MVIVNRNNTPKNFSGKAYSNIGFVFLKNNQFHRYYGPSSIFLNTKNKYWDFNGKFYGSNDNLLGMKYSQSKFLKDLNKQWLL